MKFFSRSMGVVFASLCLTAPVPAMAYDGGSVIGFFESGVNCVPTGRDIDVTYTVQGALVGRNFLDTTVVCPARVDAGIVGLFGGGDAAVLVNIKDSFVNGTTMTCRARSTGADPVIAPLILDTQVSAGDTTAQTLALDISDFNFDGSTVLTIECSVPNGAQVRSYGIGETNLLP